MLPLNLRYSLNAFGAFYSRKGLKSFQKLAIKVLERDENRCLYCGFQSPKYQEVVNIDGNYRHNNLDNLATACCFCAQCHFIESVGDKGYGGGTLIYFPEISQNELNALSHVLFFSMTTESSQKETAQMLLQTFRIRSTTLTQVLGEGMSEPSTLGQLLLDYNPNNIEPSIQSLLSNIRLLPARGRFTKQLAYWVAQNGG